MTQGADGYLRSVPSDPVSADGRLYAFAPDTGGVTASLAWTEADDTFAIAGTLSINAAVGWTEADDAYSLAGTLTVTTALAWIEADDAYALAGTLTATVALAWTESDDSWAITGDIASDVVEAAVSWTEEDDTWSLSGQVVSEQQHIIPAAGWPILFEDANRYRGWSRQVESEKKRKKLIADLIGGSVSGDTIAPAIAEPVREVTAGKVDLVGETVQIDWTALRQDMDKLNVLLDAYRARLDDENDEEALLLV